MIDKQLDNVNNVPFMRDGALYMLDADGNEYPVETMPDPDVSPITGRALNANLQDLRNAHPFLPIDPPMSGNIVFGRVITADEPVVVPIPTDAQMMRITFGALGAGTTLFVSTTQIDKTGLLSYAQIVNPPPMWRSCKGLQSLRLSGNGGGATMFWSVEFWMQK